MRPIPEPTAAYRRPANNTKTQTGCVEMRKIGEDVKKKLAAPATIQATLGAVQPVIILAICNPQFHANSLAQNPPLLFSYPR